MASAPVWAAYDQARLDSEYNASGTVSSLETYFARYFEESARVRVTYPCKLDVPYGPGERERLDVFPATEPGAPVLLFMHGGFWRRMSKNDFTFFAEPFVRSGAVVAIPSYSLAPFATLDEIVRQMRAVIVWLSVNVAAMNGDPQRIVVAGHSAGGQLAGVLASTDWTAHGLAANPITGICGISGLYDLEPVRRSNVNDWLRLDEEAAARNSPSLHLPDAPMPLVAVVGERETAEFRRQTHDFAALWEARSYPVRELELAGQTHFDVVLDVLEDHSNLRDNIQGLLAR
jgi:arylformamidase